MIWCYQFERAWLLQDTLLDVSDPFFAHGFAVLRSLRRIIGLLIRVA